MRILGLETSCDETAVAIVRDGNKIISSVVSSSLPLHAKTGGVIPETAAREQVKALAPVLGKVISLDELRSIDAFGVTYGPGLIGSLLVGVEAAKTLSFTLQKPLVPVNHLIGHLYSAWLENPQPPDFPLIALIVSGGHTELLFVSGHGNWRYIGGTRDDAAGEAFDKIARLLGLGFPGGPEIETRAHLGKSEFQLPRPMIGDNTYDFSFSGLKTAFVNLVDRLKKGGSLDQIQVNNLAASCQEAIVDVLVSKSIRAAKEFGANNIVLGGGVAANAYLRKTLLGNFTGNVYFPDPKYSVDNGAMIAAAAYFNYKPMPWNEVRADASILF
ncbi:MAG: tRNA (adenosine(37)-N6)-threonylcarbamoyltransferase complex transferase subunit TsaD [Candidatus Woykebacteria bacterium]